MKTVLRIEYPYRTKAIVIYDGAVARYIINAETDTDAIKLEDAEEMSDGWHEEELDPDEFEDFFETNDPERGAEIVERLRIDGEEEART